MKLILNGQQKQFNKIETIQDLIEHEALVPNTFAIALNNIFISKSKYSKVKLKDADKIEILTAMQGG